MLLVIQKILKILKVFVLYQERKISLEMQFFMIVVYKKRFGYLIDVINIINYPKMTFPRTDLRFKPHPSDPMCNISHRSRTLILTFGPK